MKEIENLNLDIDDKNIEGSFKRIAFDLMNRWILDVESKSYRIAEIEFYYKSETHNDPYAHAHALQKTKGRWYFHGSGFDITCGQKGYYGGILIRAICDIEDDKNYIYGPLSCITEIFSNVKGVYEAKISFGLKPVKEGELIIEKPIAAPRIGLNPTKDTGKYEAFYRYLIMPKKKHAEKSRIAEAMVQQKYTDDEIKNIWG